MAENNSDPLETFHQVFDHLQALSRLHDHDGEVPKTVGDRYTDQLNRLAELGENVNDFLIPADEWRDPNVVTGTAGGITVKRVQLGGKPLELLLPAPVFRDYVERSLRFVARLIQREEASRAAEHRKSPADVLNSRSYVLATLVDAYIPHQEPIRVVRGDGKKRFLHRGLPRDFTPPWSAIEALHHEGKLIVTPKLNSWEINIPSSVMTELFLKEQAAVDSEPGQERVDRLRHSVTFNNHFHGGSHNIAQDSNTFSQSVGVVQPGDIDGLVTYLRSHGLTERGVEELHAALEGDEHEAGSRTFGARMGAFLAKVSTDATGELMAAGAIQAFTVLAPALQSYVG